MIFKSKYIEFKSDIIDKIIIHGKSSTGKTSLLKDFYQNSLKDGINSVYLDDIYDLTNENKNQKIYDLFNVKGIDGQTDVFLEKLAYVFDNDFKVIFIDNLSRFFTMKELEILSVKLSNLCDKYRKRIFISDTKFSKYFNFTKEIKTGDKLIYSVLDNNIDYYDENFLIGENEELDKNILSLIDAIEPRYYKRYNMTWHLYDKETNEEIGFAASMSPLFEKKARNVYLNSIYSKGKRNLLLDEMAWITYFFIHPDYRNLGIGTKFFMTILNSLYKYRFVEYYESHSDFLKGKIKKIESDEFDYPYYIYENEKWYKNNIDNFIKLNNKNQIWGLDRGTTFILNDNIYTRTLNGYFKCNDYINEYKEFIYEKNN